MVDVHLDIQLLLCMFSLDFTAEYIIVQKKYRQPNFSENKDGWLVVLFYGLSTLFGSFNAELKFKQIRL